MTPGAYRCCDAHRRPQRLVGDIRRVFAAWAVAGFTANVREGIGGRAIDVATLLAEPDGVATETIWITSLADRLKSLEGRGMERFRPVRMNVRMAAEARLRSHINACQSAVTRGRLIPRIKGAIDAGQRNAAGQESDAVEKCRS